MTDNMRQRIVKMAILTALLLTSSSCALLPSGPDPDTTPTDLSTDDVLTYRVPVNVITLEPGETIPYTQLTFVEHEGNLFKVLIDNQPAEKRVWDSFRWRGVIAPGVSAKYDLRVAPTFSQENMLAGGTIEIGVFSPIPVELESNPPSTDEVIHFANILVDYRVPLGTELPGTTLTYEGSREDGAELNGVGGYPYRAVGDSIVWLGRLRDNVIARYSLRIVSIKEESLRLIGTAELWITPGR